MLLWLGSITILGNDNRQSNRTAIAFNTEAHILLMEQESNIWIPYKNLNYSLLMVLLHLFTVRKDPQRILIEIILFFLLRFNSYIIFK